MDAGIIVSLFIDPEKEQVEASYNTGAQFIEMHTGTYSLTYGKESGEAEFLKLKDAAQYAQAARRPRLPAGREEQAQPGL